MIFFPQKVRYTDVPSCNLDVLKLFLFFAASSCTAWSSGGEIDFASFQKWSSTLSQGLFPAALRSSTSVLGPNCVCVSDMLDFCIACHVPFTPLSSVFPPPASWRPALRPWMGRRLPHLSVRKWKKNRERVREWVRAAVTLPPQHWSSHPRPRD